jgi:hypothetical protein
VTGWRYGGKAVGRYVLAVKRPLLRTPAFQVVLSLLLLGVSKAAAQDLPPYRLTTVPPSSSRELTVYLMTMGPGKRVWERFGHNAIWIHDPVKGTDKAYNYGLFDLQQENFLVRFLQGRMWYWMEGFPAQSYVELYRKANRSVWIQELDIRPTAKRQLQEFLEWNERPENRFYHYDYYRDNCSTRIRDALDRALGGRILETTGGLMTERTYRFHTRRLTANDPLVYTGLLLALGQPVDRRISAWEEMFLPLALREHLRNVTVDTDAGERPLVRSERTLFESTATAPPDRPPFWLPAYLVVGLVIGGAAFALARRAPAHRPARTGFAFCAALWALVAGVAGLVLAGLWGLTDHTAAYRNENVLQVSVLALPLLWLVPRAFRNPRPGRRAFMVAMIVAGLSAVGLLLKLFSAFYQVNGEILALALPVHLGVAAGLWRVTRG